MQKEQIVGLAVRLFAIFLVVYTIRYGSSLLPMTHPPNNVSFLLITGFTVPLLLAAFLLWTFPLTIAKTILPEVKTSSGTVPLEASGIQVVAFSILGLWVLSTAVPDVFYWSTFIYLAKGINFSLTPEHIGNALATVIELVIGFWLLFGAKGLRGLLRLARTSSTAR
jgi:hypothetical protein